MPFDDQFQRDTVPASQTQETAVIAKIELGANGATRFLSARGGASYENGLYRIHPAADMLKWTKVVEKAFPGFRKRIFCFGYDWMGRMFAVDFARKATGQYLILLLEPGTGQALEIPANFMSFHDQELVEYRDAALGAEAFKSWLASGQKAPSFKECIGYKTPVFLNGGEAFDNMEVLDMEEYWLRMGQLLSKARKVSDGSTIFDVRRDG